MGSISDALKQASGVVSQGVNSATNATGVTSGAGASGSLPQMDMSQQILSAGGMSPGQVALSGPGIPQGALSQSGPSSSIPGLSLNDLLGTNSQGAQQLAMSTNPGVNNPYSNIYQQSTPEAAAASIGAPSQGSPDSWQPSHHEGTLAKIGDFFFHNMFRDRTVEANERDALKASTIDGKLDPNLAAQRLEQIPGANPAAGPGLIERMAQANAYQGMGEQRQDSARDKAMGIISNVFGPSSSIMSAPADQQAALYGNVRPLLYTMGKNAGLPTETLDKMLPEQFDPQVAKTVGTMGMSGFDQGRLTLEGQNVNSQVTDRDARLGIAKQELGLSALGKQIEVANYKETVNRDQQNLARLDQGQVLQAREAAQKQGVVLDSGFAPYQNLKPGQYVLSPDKSQLIMKRPDGYLYKYAVSKGSKGQPIISLDNPLLRGTTVSGFLNH